MAVPPLNPFVRITNEQGQPTPDFMQWWTAQRAANDIIVPLSTPAEVSAVLDLLGDTHGDLLFRGASIWDTLGPGTAGFVLSTGGPGAPPVWVATTAQVMTLTTRAVAFSITNALLTGLHVAQTTFSTEADVTVPSGLTGTEPMEIVWLSGDRPTVLAAAGVDIVSPDGALALRTVGSWAKLTPRGSDNYLLWGDLTVGVGNGKLLLLQGDFSGSLSLQGDAASGISYLVLEGV